MGWWGHESDANDSTYDHLGVSVPERFRGADAIEDGRDRMRASEAFGVRLHEMIVEIDESQDGLPVGYKKVAFVGIVRMALVKRLRVALHLLERAKGYATMFLGDDYHTGKFDDPELRKKCLRDEIAMMEDALEGTGTTELGEPSKGLHRVSGELPSQIPDLNAEPPCDHCGLKPDIESRQKDGVTLWMIHCTCAATAWLEDQLQVYVKWRELRVKGPPGRGLSFPNHPVEPVEDAKFTTVSGPVIDLTGDGDPDWIAYDAGVAQAFVAGLVKARVGFTVAFPEPAPTGGVPVVATFQIEEGGADKALELWTVAASVQA